MAGLWATGVGEGGGRKEGRKGRKFIGLMTSRI